MGKRKERRLTAANRRVKLDLLAEPSGDFGDSSNQEEVGVGGNGKHHAGSPDSPSSSEFQHFNKISGQRPENPLLLLGQYSDEEVEEDSSKEINHDARENSPTVLDEQQVLVRNHDSTGAVEDKNLFAENVDQENKEPSSMDVLPNMENIGVIEDDKPEPNTETVDTTSASLTSDMQATVDVDSGWKMVLHEESNSYYYWNIVTGETSWEIPVVLTQGNGTAYDPKSGPEIGETHATSVDTQANNESINDMVFEAKEINNSSIDLKVHDENYTDIMANNKDGGLATQSCDVLSNAEVHNDSVIQDTSGHVYHGTGGESSDSFRLLQLGENLAERLKSLKGSEGFSDQISKLTFELDIRLADIKSLVPYGSSLLPFWLHSENQLKNLESSINNEVLKHSQFTNIGEINESENRLQGNIGETRENAIPENIVTNVGHPSVEDDDMDVEMEVEDTAIHSKDEVGGQNGPHLDQSISPAMHERLDSHGSEQDSDIPLPPIDDWIPPPPPDEEPLPPPPPDEPTEAAFPPPPPSEMQTTQSYSYGEQYSFAYPGSGLEYYGQTNTEISSNGYYVDANGSHIAAPLPSVYYPPGLNPEPVTYYTVRGGAIPTTPVISGVEASGLQNNIISDKTKSSAVVPSISASSHVPESSSVTRDVSVASASAVAPPETVPKVQPKVTRNKKRTVAAVPTLRSNKKVSGLVDKWKAVKEELHEDEEDEPENALEVLEKKRQREIEQWHAQQIASGEAKDNANFQPLGGDWRERVRRKRAKKSTQDEENPANAIDETKQQPDLAELSKQLPTGWQAYWDDSSKQVYYGNSITSETTWTKPTK